MIYPLTEGPNAGCYVISSKGQWLPGVYETHAAAQWAFQFSDKELREVKDWCDQHYDGIISTDDLHDKFNERQFMCPLEECRICR